MGWWWRVGTEGMGLWKDWELGGRPPSSLPAIVSTSSVVSPKSPLPALRASLLPPNSTLFHRPADYTAHLLLCRPFCPFLLFGSIALAKSVSFSLSTSFTLAASERDVLTFKYQSICASRLIELPLIPSLGLSYRESFAALV